MFEQSNMPSVREDNETLFVTADSTDVQSLNEMLDKLQLCDSVPYAHSNYCWYWMQKPLFIKRKFDLKSICKMNCEDCVYDIWMATLIIRDLSVKMPYVQFHLRIHNTNVNYILIELADFLDEWVNEIDERNSKVLMINGSIYLDLLDSKSESTGEEMDSSVKEKRLLSLNTSANEYFNMKLAGIERMNPLSFTVRIPCKMAASIDLQPQILTEIVHLYMDHVQNSHREEIFTEFVTHKIQMSRDLFAKLYFRCKDVNKLEYALISGFIQLISQMTNAKSNGLSKPISEGNESQIKAENDTDDCMFRIASDVDVDRFMANRHQQQEHSNVSDHPDLSWLYLSHLKDIDEKIEKVSSRYKTADLHDIDVTVKEFFGKRSHWKGAEIPWRIDSHNIKPLNLDSDVILDKLKNMSFETQQLDTSDSDSTSTDSESESSQGDIQSNDQYDKLLQSCYEVAADPSITTIDPFQSILMSFGINVDEHNDLYKTGMVTGDQHFEDDSKIN